MASTPLLPPIPQTLPKSQADWVAVVNALQGWQRILQAASWQAPTLLNSWAYYGSPYNPIGYLLDVSGRVWLRGLLSGSAASMNTVAFTLPYVPIHQSLLSATTSSGPLRIDVEPNGNVLIGNGGSGAAPTWVSLDGLSLSLSV